MKKEIRKKSVFGFVIALVVGLVIGSLVGLLFRGFMYWAFRPTQVSYSDSAKENMEKYLGVRVPSDARFLEGWCEAGKDATYYFFFEMDIPEDCNRENADAWLRSTLGLNEEDYSQTVSSESYGVIFASGVSSRGYDLTEVIQYEKWGWAEIHYGMTEDKIVFACIYGI